MILVVVDKLRNRSCNCRFAIAVRVGVSLSKNTVIVSDNDRESPFGLVKRYTVRCRSVLKFSDLEHVRSGFGKCDLAEISGNQSSRSGRND